MIRFMLIGICFLFQSVCFGKETLETMAYVLHQDKQSAIETISQHPRAINMIIAQAYHIDRNGILTGAIDKEVIQLSQEKSIKLLAMVTNSSFDTLSVHHFLSNSTAETKAINAILDACHKNHLQGVQFDFEMVSLSDKNALTHFYQLATNALHHDGYVVSFAVGPTLSDDHFASLYQQRLYQVWEGAYDLKKLGIIGNFITLMAYDQHGAGTTPGPMASVPWDEAIIQHALKFIPKEKLLLGIPVYSGFWYLNISKKRTEIEFDQLDNKTLNYIIQKFHPLIRWDEVSQVNYTFFESNALNKFIFIENEKSFLAKMQLAKKYHLHGIAIFRLGIEDLGIWKNRV